jgi:hypothetical protein
MHRNAATSIDAETAEMVSRKRPPVARCAFHPPRRAECPVRRRGRGRCDGVNTAPGFLTSRVGHDPFIVLREIDGSDHPEDAPDEQPAASRQRMSARSPAQETVSTSPAASALVAFGSRSPTSGPTSRAEVASSIAGCLGGSDAHAA